jgi:hypothetical protein
MSLFGRRPREFETLENELRQGRARPNDDFVDEILTKIATAGPQRRPRRPRIALALAFAATTVVIFSAFGGLGYAKSASTHAVSSTSAAVKSVVRGKVKSGNSATDKKFNAKASKASHDQYEEKLLLCHHPPGNPGKPITISVGSAAVPVHLAQHVGDHIGPCTPSDFESEKKSKKK